MRTGLRLFWAHVRANVWCLFHFGYCIRVDQVKEAGKLWPKTINIETGKGSILKKTWKTARRFYSNGETI